MINTNKVLGNILGNPIKKDGKSKNKEDKILQRGSRIYVQGNKDVEDGFYDITSVTSTAVSINDKGKGYIIPFKDLRNTQ